MYSQGTSRKRVGIAICGFGRAGRIHFSGIQQNHQCYLKYVVDMVEDRAVLKSIQDKLEDYGLKDVVKVVGKNGFEESVLNDDDVEAIFVTTPTESHEFYVRRALKAGRAVFCEKPIAKNIKDIAECYDIAAQVNKPLFCAFNQRFDPGMSKVYQKVREGKIGKVYQIKTCSRDAGLPPISYLKTSPGIFHDSAIHDFDMICWILGEEPVGVFAQGTAFNPEVKAIGDVDAIAVILKFPSGVLATIDLSRHSHYGYDQRLEVFGSKGMLCVENIREDPVAIFDENGISHSTVERSFFTRYEKSYQNELNSFIDVVINPSLTLSVTREQTLLCARVANACGHSMKEGKMVSLEPLPNST